MTQLLGKYRGTVTLNLDPENRGRVMVAVPHVLASPGWAMPCVPYAGAVPPSGFYAVPDIGANVWVEFEGGRADHPIWTGCFWERGQTPPLALVPPAPVAHILLQTPLQNFIHISDDPATGGIMFKTATGMIRMDSAGITIQSGTAIITLMGATVAINGTALTIT